MKKAEASNWAPNSERPKISLMGADNVTINVVANPKMKKMAPKADIPTLKLLSCLLIKI
jgi:hypothetical protein